jgi:hypothetical protein
LKISSEHKLYKEFSDRLILLKHEGAVDFKTTVNSVIITLNNVLRLRSEGNLKKLDIFLD